MTPLRTTPASAHPPTGLPVLRLGFRPFYLGAGAVAVIWMGVWSAMMTGRVSLGNGMPPILWHAHEMLFGFVTAVIVGFLLTAGKVWTGRATPRGGALAMLWLLWLAGRIASVGAPPAIFAACDTAFLLTIAILFGALIIRSRNWRNLPIAGVLFLLAASNLAFHLASMRALPMSPLTALLGGFSLVVVLTSVIGGRVIPAFTQSVSPGWKSSEPRWLSTASIATTAAGLVLWISAAPGPLCAITLAIAAVLQAARLACWNSPAVLRRPILWILHLSYAWTPIGLALLAASAAGWTGTSAGVHALAVGCIGGLVLGMMTRTARGHTGRPLHASSIEVTSYVLIGVAALFRVATPFLPLQFQSAALLLAVCAWTAAFALYLARYSVWLMTARLDGRDG
ncbi:NnrS family protein [Variovorax rhizosphaerae]|uniref:NnrS family protein n=1 Tax=Variovorax rhizosphaerae TaxID=1836200 RepID=A0ABU8WXZ2_9BURK